MDVPLIIRCYMNFSSDRILTLHMKNVRLHMNDNDLNSYSIDNS
jgi:hypothetical protein